MEPVAETLNVALLPEQIVLLVGFVPTDGAVCTVNVAPVEVAEEHE